MLFAANRQSIAVAKFLSRASPRPRQRDASLTAGTTSTARASGPRYRDPAEIALPAAHLLGRVRSLRAWLGPMVGANSHRNRSPRKTIFTSMVLPREGAPDYDAGLETSRRKKWICAGMRHDEPQRGRIRHHASIGPCFSATGLIVIGLTVLAVGGCTSLLPDNSEQAEKDARMRELMRVPDPPDLVRDAAVAQGLQPIEVDGVSIVNGLPGTGGAADPSVYRDQLLEEMKRYDVADPNHYLEQTDTALVRVRATIAAGARRGDAVDIRLLAPKESRSSDLHSGWLLNARLRQQQVLQNMVRRSDVMASGTGPVLTRADYTPRADEALKIEGNVISGGRVLISRKLNLVLRPEYQHAMMSKAIASEINERFFFFDGTTRRGIARPIEDDFIEIEVHPRYRVNIPRLMEVLRSIRVKSPGDAQVVLEELADRLKKPETAADAALQLEAIGESAVPTLLDGIQNTNPELRFYAAEALAYLDRTEAIAPLEEAAREVAAFRQPALMALQGLDHELAVEALMRLMNQPSIETRYGSFCALRRRDDSSGRLAGQPIGSFWLYEIASSASPAIAISLRESPEIVVFGETKPLRLRKFIRIPGGLLIQPDPSDAARLKLSRFQAGKDDQRAVVPSTVVGAIRGIAEVGGGYGDAIRFLRTAKDEGYLDEQLAIDPSPRGLRTYHRESFEKEDSDGPSELLKSSS